MNNTKNKTLNNRNMRNTLVVLTFFALWITGFVSPDVERTLAFIMIFSFGILHGANDIYILTSLKGNRKKKNKGIKILGTYVAFVFLGAIIFYFLPVVALLSFIIFSGYHFGEQHWHHRISGKEGLISVLYLSYGFLILGILFSVHGTSVAEVIESLTGFYPGVFIFYSLTIISFIVFVITVLIRFKDECWRILPLELLLLGIFFIVFNAAELIWAFAIYFILWHAIPSLIDQLNLLYGEMNLRNGLKYLKSSAVYWIAALISLAAAFIWFGDDDNGFLPLFFAFLAAITFPHVLVMTGLYRR